MPLNYALVHVARPVSTPSPTFGLTKPVLTEIAGSPFLARVYRVPQTTVQRDEAQPGTATVDQMQRLSVLDPLCGVQVGDIAFLPRADGSFARAKVIRIRFYSDRIQYDLETGAEGSGPLPALDLADNSSADAVDTRTGVATAGTQIDIADSASADITG